MTDWPSKQEEIWFQAGVIGEKQRIIKLLEEHADLRGAHYHEDYCRICRDFYGLGVAIALIKEKAE